MLIVNLSERKCCTCDHWRGTRIREGDGCVYSLENLEGVCTWESRSHQETMLLSAPYKTCGGWKNWEGGVASQKIDYDEYFDGRSYIDLFERPSPGCSCSATL